MAVSEIPHMTYQQYRTARRLVHECCNYDCGNCLLLDNGEECVCPQSITYSLRACLISHRVRIGEIGFLSCKAKSRSNPDGLQGFLTQSGRKICRQGGRGEMLNWL